MASRFYRKCGMLAVGVLAIAALAASPALAGGSTTTAYKCWEALNPVTNAGTYTISGSGFPAGMVVNVYIKGKLATWIINGSLYAGGTVAADGTFSLQPIASTVFYPSDLGTKSVWVVNAYDTKTTTLATCTFSVK